MADKRRGKGDVNKLLSEKFHGKDLGRTFAVPQKQTVLKNILVSKYCLDLFEK
jgi:hypothetical protein